MDVDQVVARAQEAGVTTIVNVGTSIESSQQAIELAEKFESCLAIVGIHPHHADKVSGEWIQEIERMCDHPKVMGIGEIGLDFFSYKSNGIVDPKIQKEVFRTQIELSIEKKLPLQIHNRHAGKEVLEILSEYADQLHDPPGVFHCFAGDMEVYKGVLELGFAIGIDGNSTYPGLAPGETLALPEIVKNTPLARLLIETDSPYLTPIPLRGTRNEPKNAIIVGAFVAQLKNVSETKLDQVTTQNFKRIFQI
jgi:TatD DNase family protein